MKSYKTMTGRTLDLRSFGSQEKEVAERLLELYRAKTSWKDFSNLRQKIVREALPDLSIPERQKHPLYRMAEDLEGRLGVAQGFMAPPDYRDYLIEAIHEKFGSRYRFCKETGISSSLLSQVLSGKKDFSLSKLGEVAKTLGLSLIFVPEEELSELQYS